ncbi:unnamed protein product [Rotaria socialis]|uniref:Uncharacterized protein n=1 Tax=Rotaria socialis TaxID=392032 RepID=A0A818U0T1_9BILA|nr:unnamed protein product [Rotaria socialis]
MDYFDKNASTRKHRSTKNKIPARYILTPILPSRKFQNPINENIDPYSRNCITQNGGQSSIESEHDDFDDNDEHDDDSDEERKEEVENNNEDGNCDVNQR